MRKKLPLLLFVFTCLFLLAGCPTRFEKRMVGTYRISSMTINNREEIDVSLAFDSAVIILTKRREFTINVEFNSEFIHSAETRAMFRRVLEPYYNSHKPSDGSTLEDLIDSVISGFENKYTLTGTFTNTNGTPIFTSDDPNIRLSDYGFNTFSYAADVLKVHGLTKGIIVTDFVFQKG